MKKQKIIKTRFNAILSALLIFLIFSSFFKFENQMYSNSSHNDYGDLEKIQPSVNWDLTGTPITISGNADWVLKAASEP
ncbi:MAG: hypothetical protein ACTSPN_05365 [Promethearchaeota archaeon]